MREKVFVQMLIECSSTLDDIKQYTSIGFYIFRDSIKNQQAISCRLITLSMIARRNDKTYRFTDFADQIIM